MTTIGQYRNRVTLFSPGAAVPDGDGGYTEGWEPLDPPDWDCAIRPATTRDLETIAAGTVIAQASHVVQGRYHAGISTKTRIVFDGRVLNVVAVANPHERDIRSDLICVESVE